MGYAVNRQLATDDLPRSPSDANHAHMRVGVLTLPVCRGLSPVLRIKNYDFPLPIVYA